MSHASLTRPNKAGKVVHGCNLSSSFFHFIFKRRYSFTITDRRSCAHFVT